MERCGFFDAHLEGSEYDRVYLAEHFAAYFSSFIANGVYAEYSNQLQVMSMTTPQMQVLVESGQGWINGYWYENTDDLYLQVDVADGVLSRIDSVVLRLGLAERDMWLEVKKGVPAINPVAPSVTRDADYYELQLATISVPAGSIQISQSQITDTRMDQSVCGWVTGVVQQLDTTTLFEQFEAYFAEFKESHEADFEEWSTEQAEAFNAWFEEMKDQLSEDAAGHLQNQITALSGDVDDLGEIVSGFDSRIDTVETDVSALETTVDSLGDTVADHTTSIGNKIDNPSVKSNGQVLTYNGSDWVAQNASGGLSANQYTVTIPSSSWTTSGRWRTKTVTVSGLKATYPVAPVVDCVLTGSDAASDEAVLAAFGKLAVISTAANSITVKAIDEKPSVNIPIIISVWE